MLYRLLNLLRNKPNIQPSEKLKTFLAIDELDDLLTAYYEMGSFSKEDEKYVRLVLRKWKDRQAVANLLHHASMIPGDIQFKYLRKGLLEKREIYYNLSAIVGVQEPEYLDLTGKQKEDIKEILFTFLRGAADVRGSRALQALVSYCTEADTAKIISCATNKDENIRENILRFLVKLHGEENIKEVLLKHEWIYDDEVEILGNRLAAHYEKINNAPEDKKGFFALTLGMPRITYIPNLKDVDYK